MKIGELLKSLWARVRKLPVARYLKPLWKGLLKELVQRGIDQLQVDWAPRIARGEAQAAAKAVDGLLAGLERAFNVLPLPPALEAEWLARARGEGAHLKAKLEALSGATLPAINAAIDESQSVLIAWVESR